MKKPSGFTLIEFIFYMGALLILLGAILYFGLNFVRNERSLGDKVRTFGEADFALRQVVDSARISKSIRSDSGADASKFSNSTTPCLTNCILAVNKAGSSACSGTITADTAKFYVDGAGRLIMEEKIAGGAGCKRELTSPAVLVSKFTVLCIGASSGCGSSPKSVQLTLVVSGVANPTETQTLTTSITPRGY